MSSGMSHIHWYLFLFCVCVGGDTQLSDSGHKPQREGASTRVHSRTLCWSLHFPLPWILHKSGSPEVEKEKKILEALEPVVQQCCGGQVQMMLQIAAFRQDWIVPVSIGRVMLSNK